MTRYPRPSAIVLVGATLALAACGGGDPSAPPALEPEPALDVAVCSAGWHVLFSPEQDRSWLLAAQNLLWHRDRLYFTQRIPRPKISSLSTGGGAEELVREGIVSRFWIEDGRLLFVDLESHLYAMPLAGGPAELVLDAPNADPRAGIIPAWALDREALYSVRDELRDNTRSQTVYRAPRNGQPATAIGRAPSDAAPVEEIFLVGGLMIVSDLRPGVWTIPTAGGEPRVLAAGRMNAESPDFLGVSPEGVLLWRQFEPGPVPPPGMMSTSRYVVTTSRIEDGKPPQRFWSTRAKGVFPMKAWADGARWYLAAWERDKHDWLHATLWTIDAQGQGARLACDPEVGGRIVAGAVGPDGFYGVIDSANDYWEIARVPRAP